MERELSAEEVIEQFLVKFLEAEFKDKPHGYEIVLRSKFDGLFEMLAEFVGFLVDNSRFADARLDDPLYRCWEIKIKDRMRIFRIEIVWPNAVKIKLVE